MLNNFLLHAEHSHGGGFAEFLCDRLGAFGDFLYEVVISALFDTLLLVPFLFLTYLLMEFIEHKASDKAEKIMSKAGAFGPAVGGALGTLPQCGFSAAAANLYAGRVITLGTLIAVFLSTSDEMLPILLAGAVAPGRALLLVIYKAAVGIAVGFVIDFILVRIRGREDVHIVEMCKEGGCGCERGIFRSALHHTLTVSLFILAVSFAVSLLIFFIGEEGLKSIFPKIPFVSHIVAAVVGLIPNCASSVALTRFAVSGIITHGTMLSGLFSGAGVGILILFKVNKKRKENFIILASLVLIGAVFGLIADLLPFLSVAA